MDFSKLCLLCAFAQAWLQTAIDLYTQRLRSVVEVECVWVKDDPALAAQVVRSKDACIVLDERGKLCTSVEFTDQFYRALEDGGSRLSFFIGGADGLPPELKADQKRLLSLSKLTFTHRVYQGFQSAPLAESLSAPPSHSQSLPPANGRPSDSRLSQRWPGCCSWSKSTVRPRSEKAQVITRIEDVQFTATVIAGQQEPSLGSLSSSTSRREPATPQEMYRKNVELDNG